MPIQVLTEHKDLEYFMTTKKLTPRQVRWAEFLSEFNFVISYQSGKKNNKTNALTCKPGNHPNDEEDKQLEYRVCVLLPPECFQQSAKLQLIEKNEKEDQPSAKIPNPKTPSTVEQSEPRDSDKLKDLTLPENIMQANQKENLYTSICVYLEDLEAHAKPEGIKLKSCRVSKGLLMKRNQLWVSDNKGL